MKMVIVEMLILRMIVCVFMWLLDPLTSSCRCFRCCLAGHVEVL